ncbi:MAG: phosphoribosylglycinamide formyltransferase [candidate division WOR-3 bacterium]|nr:phosphoribosylglycinamide formyltransferase [candidate division WOR-3 bacterium]
MPKKRIGALVSGRGTNLQAIIDSIERKEIDAEIAVVISNIKDAYALERAKNHNIPGVVINHKDFPNREAFEKALIDELDKRKVDLICLAGFMRVLTPFFVNHYQNRIMNIHPALLPAFKGLYGHHVHEAVLKSGAKFSGCSVHFVTEDVDGGPIIVQRMVPVKDSDTPDTLADRVLSEEHKAYSEAIKLFSEDRLKVEGNRVKILEK